MKSLLYLEYRQLVNLMRLTLRTPKRLVPVVLMLVWLLFVILMQVLAHMTGGTIKPPPMYSLVLDMAHSGLLIFMILLSLYVVYRSFSESLVIYSPAEMDVLIAMPIKRRLVMGLKLGSIYARFGFYLALMGLFVGMQSVESVGYAPLLAVVAWLALVLYAAVIINISTVINLIVAHTRAQKWWQRTLVLGLMLGLILIAGVTYYAAYGSTGDAMIAFAALIRQPVLVTLAAPAVWASGIAMSLFRGWQPAFGWQMPALALLAFGTMLMVLARKENPYEPSLRISAQKALIRTAIKSGGWSSVRTQLMSNRIKSAPTLIAPFGRGATAILWKNMLISARVSRPAIIAVAMIVPAIALIGRTTIKDKGLLEFAPGVMTGVALYMSWILAMMMQQMLRGDLKQVNILKPMPISPWWLMVAETANAGLMVWGFIWLLFGSAVFLLGAPASDLMIVAGLSLPFVAYSSICSQTTVAVLYPNWGDMSQQWIANLMSMMLTVLSVGPPVAIGAIMWFLKVPPAIMSPAVIATSLALAAGGITLGAATYRSHDPTDE